MICIDIWEPPVPSLHALIWCPLDLNPCSKIRVFEEIVKIQGCYKDIKHINLTFLNFTIMSFFQYSGRKFQPFKAPSNHPTRFSTSREQVSLSKFDSRYTFLARNHSFFLCSKYSQYSECSVNCTANWISRQFNVTNKNLNYSIGNYVVIGNW